jgi:hypothetical protein
MLSGRGVVGRRPPQEPDRSAEALRRALPELLKLDRYERRALSRRDRAVQRFINLRLRDKPKFWQNEPNIY